MSVSAFKCLITKSYILYRCKTTTLSILVVHWLMHVYTVTLTQIYSMSDVLQYACMSFMQCSEPFDELSPGVVHVGSVVCSYSTAESSTIVSQSGCTREPHMC